ncbi:MAG: glycosyltransferase family 2 protein [Bacteroidales bacterium]|nr:glycosyltransferase family 2 protein [Bacteroidales bacterium]
MIAILMSTYNGSTYLREQIDSILKQTVKEWKLYVRDDGSKDSTLEILTEYENRYPERINVVNDVPYNLGAGESFMHLLSVADADYYMFCDQDDVWMPNKIERTMSKLLTLEEKYGKDKGIGVFTDLTVVDSKLNVLMSSLWKADNRHPEYVKSFYKQWTNRHASYGCTQMFNRAAKSLVLPYKQFEGVMGAHDNWLEYILIKQGVYDYLDEPTILYRQHGTNVVGANFNHGYKEDIQAVLKKPSLIYEKLKKDYERMKLMPFYVSPTVVLWYRIYQSVCALFRR